ncbi:MAG: hypothetical protein EHM40_20385 [Chloroflexi bacterium]|nr:MAG: hypothetical protein EHM40_20385 [Chloroflexota bacterium]
MNNSSSKKKKLSVAQALGYSLLLTALIGGAGTLFVYFPDTQSSPIPGLITVWGLSITMGIAGFWNARSPHWMAVFIIFFSLTTLFLAGAIHALDRYLTGWLWLTLLVGAYLLAWALPFLNPRLSRVLSEAQSNQQTWLGRRQVLTALLIAILGAVLLGIFTRERRDSIQPFMLVTGTIFSMLAVGGGQYFAHQVRVGWEEQTRQASR